MPKGNERPETIEFWKWLTQTGITDEFVFAVVKCLKDSDQVPPKKALDHIYSQLNGGKSFTKTARDAAAVRRELEKEYRALESENDELYARLEKYEPELSKKTNNGKKGRDDSSNEASDPSDPEEIDSETRKKTPVTSDKDVRSNRGSGGILKGRSLAKSLGQVRFDMSNIENSQQPEPEPSQQS